MRKIRRSSIAQKILNNNKILSHDLKSIIVGLHFREKQKFNAACEMHQITFHNWKDLVYNLQCNKFEGCRISFFLILWSQHKSKHVLTLFPIPLLILLHIILFCVSHIYIFNNIQSSPLVLKEKRKKECCLCVALSFNNHWLCHTNRYVCKTFVLDHLEFLIFFLSRFNHPFEN